MITTFEPDIAIVVALSRHDEQGFYASLAQTLEIASVGQKRQSKPACCGEDGWPSVGQTAATRQARQRQGVRSRR